MKAKTEERWRGLIRGQEQSGATIQKFCAEQGVSAASFYAWRRRLGTSQVMKFAVVETAGQLGGGIELRLASGESLMIPGGADAATLRMILGVIREQP